MHFFLSIKLISSDIDFRFILSNKFYFVVNRFLPHKLWHLNMKLNSILLIVVLYPIVINSISPRINCYPESESSYSNYSKASCLSRHCLYDDQAKLSDIQCYLSPNYGYILQEILKTSKKNIFKFRLKRNQAIKSIFPEPIENVLFEIEYYTNDIIRFKFYDADHQRYEVYRYKPRFKLLLIDILGSNSIKFSF